MSIYLNKQQNYYYYIIIIYIYIYIYIYFYMKRQKMITIDESLVKDLDKINASELINELLKDYFNQTGHLREKEIKEKINKNQLTINEMRDEIEELERSLGVIKEQKEKVKAVYKNVPTEVMSDFQYFNKMTIDTLKERYNTIYRVKYNDLTFDELKAAFCEFRGIEIE